MKSYVINHFGNPDVFVASDLPKPVTAPGHVLIKVAATSVNPLDCKIRRGDIPAFAPKFPMILHGDVAGVITEVGQGVKKFAVGDEVYGCVGGLLAMAGALSEYVLADAQLIALKPARLSMIEAAAVPLVALTAWEALVTYADVQPKQTVLVHGGMGGVGHFGVQLAKYLKADVSTTISSNKNTALAKKLGADHVINYKENSVDSYVKQYTNGVGFDVVFDTVGDQNLIASIEAAANFGQVVTTSAIGSYDLTPAFFKGLSIHTIFQPLPLLTGLKRQHYGDILSTMARIIDDGEITPLIDDTTFAIHEVGLAHQHLEQGKAIGKVVLSQ